MISSKSKYWLFLGASILTGLYLLNGTNKYVSSFVDYRVSYFPIINIKYYLAGVLFYLLFKIFVAMRR